MNTMFLKGGLAALCLLIGGMSPSIAMTPLARDYVPGAQLVGQAKMTYLFWDVYDARLFAANGRWQETQPLALELRYLRALKGDAIAARSIKEIRKQGFTDEVTLAKWQKTLMEIFPDVTEDSVLTGVADNKQITRFYFNEQLIGKVNDPAFTQWFFRIWLGDKTSEPELRDQLLGKA